MRLRVSNKHTLEVYLLGMFAKCQLSLYRKVSNARTVAGNSVKARGVDRQIGGCIGDYREVRGAGFLSQMPLFWSHFLAQNSFELFQLSK